jgi:[acyl-carrier-protein] S-malonyltransferase
MQPAVAGMTAVLGKVSFRDPIVPIIANVTAQPLTKASQFRDELLNQLTSSVQWQKSVEYMLGQGVKSFIEIGPGKVLAGLVKRISRDTEMMNIGDASSVRSLSSS